MTTPPPMPTGSLLSPYAPAPLAPNSSGRPSPCPRLPGQAMSCAMAARGWILPVALAVFGCNSTVGNDPYDAPRTVETAVWYSLSARPQGSVAMTVRMRCGDFSATKRFEEIESGALFAGTPENTSCLATLSGTVGDYVVSGSASGRSGTDLDILASPILPTPLFLRASEERGWTTYTVLLGPPGAEVCWTSDSTAPRRSGTCAVTTTGEIGPSGKVMWAAEMSLPSSHPTLRVRSFQTGWTSSDIVEVSAFSSDRQPATLSLPGGTGRKAEDPGDPEDREPSPDRLSGH